MAAGTPTRPIIRRWPAPPALWAGAILAALTACEGSGSNDDAGPPADVRIEAATDLVSDLPPLPAQTCVGGLITTHVSGPELSLSSAMPAGRASRLLLPPLALGSGQRRLPARIGRTLRRCLARAGCLAIAAVARPSASTWRRLALQGVHLVEPLHGPYVTLALEPRAHLRELMSGGLILAVDLLRPADKIPPTPPGAPADARRRAGLVALMTDARGRKRRRSFHQLGLPTSRAGERRAAALPWVYRVGAARSPARPLSADVRESLRVDQVQGFSASSGLPAYSGLTGEGVTVAVVDSGVDMNHGDLRAYDAAGKDLGTRVSGAAPATSTWGPHGTSVASVLAGNGKNSAGFTHQGKKSAAYHWRGQAPRASKIISIYSGTTWAPAILPAHLSNHSYPLSWGTYNNTTAWVDGTIHRGITHGGTPHPARPTIWAIGNSGLSFEGRKSGPVGYYSADTVAKNPIVVGGTNANDDSFCTWSSHGPTLDGRIKPDVVAPSSKDHRPPGGIPAEIDEIRLKAAAGAGAADVAWTFDTDGDLEGWKLAPGLESPKVLGGALRTLLTLGGATVSSAETRLDGGRMTRTGINIDAAKYDRLELKMRLTVKAIPGTYRWPDFWIVRWNNDADPAFDHALFPSFDSARKTGAMQVHTVMLPAGVFNGTVTGLQIEPAFYGDGIIAAAAWTQSYVTVRGTSYAAPAVSGVAALLLQQLARRPDVDLVKTPPWPSSIKAVLIHTARDLVHTSADARDRFNPDTGAATLFHQGPDFATGYGLVDALSATTLVGASSAKARKWVQEKLSAKQRHTYRVSISPAVKAAELRATLVWDDAPGNPALALDQRQLVNDLDLVLIGPGGKAHGPWVLDPLPLDKKTVSTGIDPIKPADVKPARRCVDAAAWKKPQCEDHRNNVEQVVVETPGAGWWTVVVRAHALPVGPQRYSLVVSAACK